MRTLTICLFFPSLGPSNPNSGLAATGATSHGAPHSCSHRPIFASLLPSSPIPLTHLLRSSPKLPLFNSHYQHFAQHWLDWNYPRLLWRVEESPPSVRSLWENIPAAAHTSLDLTSTSSLTHLLRPLQRIAIFVETRWLSANPPPSRFLRPELPLGT